MAFPFRQTNFSGGYLSPELLGRTDTIKYQSGLFENRNCFVSRTSGDQNRSGSLFIGATKVPGNPYRAVPFILSNVNSFHLEVGAGYIRPWKFGQRISVAGAAAYNGGTTYALGDLVTSGGAVYRSLITANVGNLPSASPADWDLQVGGLLEISAPAIVADALAVLNYAQENSVMTLVSQLFWPQRLIRYSDVRWTIADFVPSTGIAPPASVNVVAGIPLTTWAGITGAIGGNGGLPKDLYAVTAFTQINPPYSYQTTTLISTATSSVGGADAANPVLISWVTAGASPPLVQYAVYKFVLNEYRLLAIVIPPTLDYSDDASVTPTDVLTFGGTPLTSFNYVVTAISETTGAESLASPAGIATGATPTLANPNTITWPAAAGATRYNVYRNYNGVYGFIGNAVSSGAGTFLDTGIIPDTSNQPPVSISLFATANDYPAAVGYFEQRLWLGNTINQPQTAWGSRLGITTGFTVSTPVIDSDAIQFTIAATKVQPIQAFVDIGKLIILTTNGEFVCLGNSNSQITPGAVNCVLQGGCGASSVMPVVIGNTAIFVQALGGMVRDLRYEIQSVQYAGKEVSIYTPDLFIGRTVVQMAWQQVKNSIVWLVMSDGALLSLTYIREENIWAWGVHDTGDGDLVTQVIVLPEGSQEVVYLGVNRLIEGVWTMGIEKLAERDFIDTSWLTDAYFPDSAQVYDGRNATGTTLTLTTSADWTPTSVFTLTASAPIFAATDAPAGNPQGVGNTFLLRRVNSRGVDTARLYFTVIEFVSATVVKVTTNANVPTWARVALTTWGKAVHAFSGIDHLEGRDLSLLGDGNILASPLNPAFPTVVTVVGGAFVTPGNVNVMVLCAGLPVLAEMITLPLENEKGDTITGKQKNIKEATATFYASRGGLYGQLPAAGDTQVLKPWKQRRLETLGTPNALFSGSIRINAMAGNWGTKGAGTGQLVIQQPDPVPLGVSAVTILAEVGD